MSLHCRECTLRPAHAWRAPGSSVCPCTVSGCIAAWARWRHIGFIQYCSIAQAIALCPDRFAGACRDPCIRTRGHGTRDHLPGECVVRPRSPRAGMMVKSFCLNIEVRDIVASVRCAQQELVMFSPVAPSPPAPMWCEHHRVESVAGKAARPQVPSG